MNETLILEIIFWSALFMVFYTYLGYGIVLKGLVPDEQIQKLIDTVVARGGYIKNLHGQKNVYYQINATYYSALGEDDRKMLLARALQLFMPGKPQIWYLDLFAGKNDYEAIDFKTTFNNLQWVLNAYTIVFAVMLLIVSKLGDMFGRKKIFIASMFVFVIASAINGMASSLLVLDIGRCVGTPVQ